MKGFIRIIIISAIAIVLISIIMYKSTIYTNIARKNLNLKTLPKIKDFLEESYLFESTNLDQMPYKFNSILVIKLKRKSVYNPNDTKVLVDKFVEKYYETFDSLSFFYYPLRTVDIKFILKDSENLGPVYFYKNRKLIENYSEIRESIIKTEAEARNEKELERQINIANEKAKRLAKRAFGFINFGDLKEDVLQKIENDPRIKVDEIMMNNPIYKVTLGSYKYNMKPVYKNNQFYLMNIVSDKYEEIDYNTKLHQNWQDIINYYTLLHGQTKYSYLGKEELEDNFIEWTAVWTLDKKHIQIGLSRTGDFYHIVIWVSQVMTTKLINFD